jgi:diacylglycerol kinase family enzyme
MDLLLYNPLSKNNKSNITTHKLVRYYKKNNLPFRLKSIIKIDDKVKFLEEKDMFENIILLGGDGTINRFVNDIEDYVLKTPIYLKSNGSGNDFLRTLKHQKNNTQEIMQATFNNTEKKLFLNGAGIGIDGLVLQYIDESKNKGKFRYFVNTIKALIHYQPTHSTVWIDGEKKEFQKTYLIVANNGKYVGGGMKITPNADLSTNTLDIIIVHTIPKWLILFIFLTIYLGIHTIFTRYVYSTKATSLKVQMPEPSTAQVDGEITNEVTTLDVYSSNKQIHFREYKK